MMKKVFMRWRAIIVIIILSLVSCSSDDTDDNRIYPSKSVDGCITEFMNAHLTGGYGDDQRSDIFFVNYDYADEVHYVINSEDEFEALCDSAIALPDIDFEKYTLIMGNVMLNDGGSSLESQYLEYQEGTPVLALKVVRSSGMASLAVGHTYYWGLYPKVSTEQLIIRKNKNGTITEYARDNNIYFDPSRNYADELHAH